MLSLSASLSLFPLHTALLMSLTLGKYSNSALLFFRPASFGSDPSSLQFEGSLFNAVSQLWIVSLTHTPF